MGKKKSLIIILLLVIIIILVLLVFFLGDKKPLAEELKGGVSLQIDPNAGEYVEPEKETTPSKGVAIPGWGSITIPANQKNITVDFMNPEANKDLYFLTFELRIPNKSKKGYEVLYKSGLVAPGLHIQKIELARALKAGEYDAVIHVQPYKMDEARTPTNNADMKTKLIVK